MNTLSYRKKLAALAIKKVTNGGLSINGIWGRAVNLSLRDQEVLKKEQVNKSYIRTTTETLNNYDIGQSSSKSALFSQCSMLTAFALDSCYNNKTALFASGFNQSSFRSSPLSSNFSINQNTSVNKGDDNLGATRQEVVSITYEEIGLFPRSFSRVFDRFLKQIFSDVENLVIQEYRFYRYLFLTTLKCLLILFIVPFLVNLFAKNYLVRPLTEYFWNTKQTEIFLNSYQQKRAFAELKDFEEKLYFSSLIEHRNKKSLTYKNTLFDKFEDSSAQSKEQINTSEARYANKKDEVSSEHVSEYLLQEKTREIGEKYNNQSIENITSFFADLLSLLTLFYLLYALEIQINITKSFLLEVFFGLDDSKKSLLILLVTDLLVGYHSSNLWELFFELIFNHYGLPESQTGIFLLVATLPVLLDVLFKYLIFRHLNRSSPATVATYHAMIE
uniref:Potassium/proton antiporter CemA n=1 Tax=Characiochloris acuminata TaxID=167768 RepID=A0A0S2LPH5_9CHLO|nr:chloroplast enveloppe membrane protein [Characiochloris acuminata]ALO63268.1 chloroplast enveloppe membrane protein [Characiochloris acuminata]